MLMHSETSIYDVTSPGVMSSLLQEIISVYPMLSPPTLTAHASNRVCNALALLQCVASHSETRGLFLNGEDQRGVKRRPSLYRSLIVESPLQPTSHYFYTLSSTRHPKRDHSSISDSHRWASLVPWSSRTTIQM